MDPAQGKPWQTPGRPAKTWQTLCGTTCDGEEPDAAKPPHADGSAADRRGRRGSQAHREARELGVIQLGAARQELALARRIRARQRVECVLRCQAGEGAACGSPAGGGPARDDRHPDTLAVITRFVVMPAAAPGWSSPAGLPGIRGLTCAGAARGLPARCRLGYGCWRTGLQAVTLVTGAPAAQTAHRGAGGASASGIAAQHHV